MRVQNFSVPPQEVQIHLAEAEYVHMCTCALCIDLFYGKVTFACLEKHVYLQILSKDSVTVFVNAIMYYKVLMI